MDNWLFFLGGMTICCAILCPLSAFSDWLQGKLDEWNEQQDNEQLNKTRTMKSYYVVWKYAGKEEQRKEFTDFPAAMRFQAGIVKAKKGLEYAKYEF